MEFIKLMDKILFPGSFDPITIGHEDIIKQATGLASKVYIGIAIDNNKKSYFSVEQKVLLINLLKDTFSNIEVIEYNGLTVELASKLKISHIVRGLRNELDFTVEKDLLDMNRIIKPEVNTIFLQPSSSIRGVSSSLVRQLIDLNKDFSPFVSKKIFSQIKQWL